MIIAKKANPYTIWTTLSYHKFIQILKIWTHLDNYKAVAPLHKVLKIWAKQYKSLRWTILKFETSTSYVGSVHNRSTLFARYFYVLLAEEPRLLNKKKFSMSSKMWSRSRLADPPSMMYGEVVWSRTGRSRSCRSILGHRPEGVAVSWANIYRICQINLVI